jgi:general secretion pathway protein D
MAGSTRRSASPPASRLSRSEYFEVFLSTLRANGLVAIPIRGGYRIQPVEGAASQPTRIGSRNASRNQVVTEIFRLRNIEAPQAVETLRPLVSAQGTVTANRNANSLIVVDFADNIARIRQLIGSIDRQSQTNQIVYLRNAGAREIATSLSALAGQNSGVAVSAVDSSNALTFSGEPGAVARLAAIARDLDARSAGNADIRVYWLEHADAEQLLPVLQQLLGQPVTQGTSAPVLYPQPGRRRHRRRTRHAAAGARPDQRKRRAEQRHRAARTGRRRALPRHQRHRGCGQCGRPAPTGRSHPPARHPPRAGAGGSHHRRDRRPAAKRLGVQFLLAGQNAPFLATNYSNAVPTS